MKLHKTIHHHIKKHHKKYLFGISLSGIGFFILKIFILGSCFFSVFNQKDGVFAEVLKDLFPALPYVELNSQNITQEPFSCSTTAETCDLSNKNIVGIASGTFINHQNLMYLYLNNNKITSIEVGDFNGAINLTTINLSENPITFVMTGAFDNFIYLYSLNLGTSCNNRQTQIDAVNYYCSNNQYNSEYTNQTSCETAGYCGSYSGATLLQFTGQSSCESHSCYNSSNTLLSEYTNQTSCENAGICQDYNGYILQEYNNQSSCEGISACYDANYGNLLSGYTNQTSCENAGICYDYNGNYEITKYTDQISCENGGTCSNNLYTDQASCENGGTCYNSNWEIVNYIDQTSCENNSSCSNNLYTDQASCENGGTCYDYNGKKLNYTSSGSCTTLGLCQDYRGTSSFTDENSCRNNGACYNYKAATPNEYTSEASCITVSHCYNSKVILLNQYIDENSCITDGYFWTGNTWKYSWNQNNRQDGNSRDLNYRQDGNTWGQNYRSPHLWEFNYRQSNKNIWKPSIWNTYYTWDSYINESTNTDDNYCSIINSSTPEGFIGNLTDNQYQLSGEYYMGYKPLSFAQGTTNQILTNIKMISERGYSEISINSGTIITSNGQPYTGILFGPNELQTGTVVGIKNVDSLIEFGDTTSSIEFSKSVTVKMSALGKNTGDVVKIFYNDKLDNSWFFHTTAIVVSDEGYNPIPYIEFTTDHATYFAIGEEIGSFVINNDDSSTTNQEVILNIDASGTQYMRFSNDNTNRSTWEAYTTSKSRTLSPGYSEKTVYAEFDTNGDYAADASTSDVIEYTNLLPGQTQGNLTLEITGGVTECVYGTSLNLGIQEVKIGSNYSFTGAFSGDRYCADFKGIDSGWAFTIQTTDLFNDKGNSISGSNVLISHTTPLIEGHSSCTGNSGTPIQFYSSSLALIEKSEGLTNNKICKVTLSNIGLQINVPANQAPGSYEGTLTITLPF